MGGLMGTVAQGELTLFRLLCLAHDVFWLTCQFCTYLQAWR